MRIVGKIPSIVALAWVFAATACQPVRTPSICPRLAEPVGAESFIPGALTEDEGIARPAAICALRHCEVPEVVNFHFRGRNMPSVYVYSKDVGRGACFRTAYPNYRKKAEINGVSSKPATTSPPACPPFKTWVKNPIQDPDCALLYRHERYNLLKSVASKFAEQRKADLSAVCPDLTATIADERKAKWRSTQNQREVSTAAICTARHCKLQSIERYTYRGRLNPIFHHTPDTPAVSACVKSEFANYLDKADRVLR